MRLTWRALPHFYWNQFLTGFCFHLILPAVLLLLLGLVAGRIAGPYGGFYLVWHEDPLRQGVVGFAVLMLTWEVLFVGYLLQTRHTPPDRRYVFARGGPQVVYSGGVLLSLVLSVVVVAAGVLLVGAATATGGTDLAALRPLPPGWRPPAWGLPFAAGALVATLLGLLAVLLPALVPSTQRPLDRLGDFVFDRFDHFPILQVERPAREDLYLHGLAACSFAFALLFFALVAVAPWFSPVVGACMLLHLVVAAYAFLAYFVPRLLPVVVLLLFGLLLLGGIPPYKQRFPGLEAAYDEPFDLAKYKDVYNSKEARLIEPDQVDFCGRSYGAHPAGQKRPVVLVCTSGGGIRSAAWALSVLQRVEAECRKKDILFPYHIRLITGASGGMLGAATYTVTLPKPGEMAAVKPEALYEYLTADALSPVVRQMVYGDLPSTFWPWPRENDRGRALEGAWSENLHGALDASFADLERGEREGWRPSLAFSPMLVEDGRRLIISNLDLYAVVRNNGNILAEKPADTFSHEAYELFRLFPKPEVRKAFRVATAVRMSATFPFFSPAVPLPTRPRRRVVDAGYYDNHGVSLAAAWLFSGRNRQWLRDHVSGVVLVQVRDGLAEAERRLEAVLPDDSTPLTRGLEWLTSPPEGLYNAVQSSAAFRNDAQLEALGRLVSDELQVDPLLRRLSPRQIEFLREARGRGQRGPLLPASLDLAGHKDAFRKLLEDDAATKGQADGLLRESMRTFDRAEGSPFFTTVTFEFAGQASLSWYLTAAEKEAIRRVAWGDLPPGEDVIGQRVERLIGWWSKRLPEAAGR